MPVSPPETTLKPLTRASLPSQSSVSREPTREEWAQGHARETQRQARASHFQNGEQLQSSKIDVPAAQEFFASYQAPESEEGVPSRETDAMETIRAVLGFVAEVRQMNPELASQLIDLYAPKKNGRPN